MDSNRRFWDRTARLYRPIQEKSNRALYDRVAGCCGRYIHGDSRVLELACGSGQLTLPLYKKAAFLTATGFSVMEQTLLPGDPLPECFVAAEAPPQGRG